VRGGVEISQGQRYGFILRAAAIPLGQCKHRSQRLFKGIIEVYFGVVHNAYELKSSVMRRYD